MRTRGGVGRSSGSGWEARVPLGPRVCATTGSLAAPGYTFGEELSGAEIEETKNYRGTHGQLPTRADMRSSLIVYGAAARVGARVPIARMIDIAPTAAAILGLKFTKAEGLPVSQIIK